MLPPGGSQFPFALSAGKIRPTEPSFIALVRQKLSVPGNDAVDVTPRRLEQLRSQLESRLRPVLRQMDFEKFDLSTSFRIVSEVGLATK